MKFVTPVRGAVMLQSLLKRDAAKFVMREMGNEKD